MTSNTEHNPDQPRDGNGLFIKTITSTERDAAAARLRSEGKSYRQIATNLGIDVHTAHDAVRRAMQAVVAPAGEQAVNYELGLLGEELLRLDDLYATVVEVLEREHVTVSQGRIVRDDDGGAVPDDDWILKAVDRLVRIDEARRRNSESRRRLLGLDQPTKTQVSGGVTYEVVGINPEDLR
jgi:hypothetical protein